VQLSRGRLSRYYLELCPAGVLPETFAFDMMHYVFAERFVRDKTVLDAGAGKGYGAYHLAKVGGARRVVGVDLDDKSLRYAVSAYQIPGVSFQKMDVTATAFRPSCFDVVVCFETLEHLPAAKTGQFMREIVRVLKPDGVFVISTPNRPVYSAISKTAGHINEMSFDELRSILKTYFKESAFYYQGERYLERVGKSGAKNACASRYRAMRERIRHIAGSMAGRTVRTWYRKRRLRRLLEERVIRKAASDDEMRGCLIQVAVCRNSRNTRRQGLCLEEARAGRRCSERGFLSRLGGMKAPGSCFCQKRRFRC